MKQLNLLILSTVLSTTIFSCSTHQQKTEQAQIEKKEEEEIQVIEISPFGGSILPAIEVKRKEDSARDEAKKKKENEEIQVIEVTGSRGEILRPLNTSDIGKFPDSNMAESLKRVSGIQLSRESSKGANINTNKSNQTPPKSVKAQKSPTAKKQKIEKVAATQLPNEPPVASQFSEEEVVEPQLIIENNTPSQSQQIFKNYHVNPTISTKVDAVSTFAMDVDSGSYHLAKQMLNNNRLPASEGIRIEEFINSFSYQNIQSTDLFSVGAQVFPSPFRKGYQVLHLNVQTQQVSEDERLNNNLVLVADVSGSMSSDNKIELLKNAFITLISQMNKEDQIAIVTYNNTANLLLPPTKVKNKRQIFDKINQLSASGGTNAEAGIKLAYHTAEQMFSPGYNNRVLLTSDGMANIGSADPEQISAAIEQSKDRGIFLTTVGVGHNMYNDHLLEQLANTGNGHYLYFANERDIQSAFNDELYQQLETVAKDAKIQVTFNPSSVSDYRLLGYENRDVADHKFLSEDEDGGEIGAGHQVTAIYEIKLTDNYTNESDFGKISVAYKKPLGNKVNFFHRSLKTSIAVNSFEQASTDSQLAFTLAEFAEKLRQSYWAQAYKYTDLLHLLNRLPQHYRDKAQVKDLEDIILKASQLDNRDLPYNASILNFDRVPVLDK